MAYDLKCLELADYFMPTSSPKRLTPELAQHIQDAVERWIAAERDRLMRHVKPE